MLLEEDIVLWRSLSGHVNAWKDLCIHRGARLSLGWIKDDTKLVCRYHGWTYDEKGTCVEIPANPGQKPPPRAVAETYLVKERYGLIWICLGMPEKDVPEFKEWNDPGYQKFFAYKASWASSGPRVIEGSIDVAHFPFVHAGLLGDRNRPEIEDYEAIVDKEGVSADIRVWKPDKEGTNWRYETSRYRIPRPLTILLANESADGKRSVAFFTVTPVKKNHSLSWLLVAMNHTDFDIDEIIKFEEIIHKQDIEIVESQRPELLPLDLQSELHLKCDRASIAYRKWLQELGLTFGTA
jgi:phenylpropionate dioxygenase-like ring-hydroxylating dioxygenase large terminal subunit